MTLDGDIPIDPSIGIPVAVAIVVIVPLAAVGYILWNARRHPAAARGPRRPTRREIVIYGSIAMALVAGSVVLGLLSR